MALIANRAVHVQVSKGGKARDPSPVERKTVILLYSYINYSYGCSIILGAMNLGHC